MGKEKGRIRELFLDLVFDIVGGFLQAIGLHCFIDSINIAPGGATEEAVRIMVDQAGGEIKVKASGGIRSREAAELFLDLGADRLGTSRAVGLLTAE